jgi:hypothetical protein
MPNTQEYQVLKHFEWGRLKLEPGQIIVIDQHAFPDSDSRVLVYIKHYRHIDEKTQPIGNKALDSFIDAGYIKNY